MTSPNNYIPANTLDRAPLARKCVARIWLENRDAGTGILLEGDWLLTCHHVLPTLEKAKGALAQFGYEQLSDGFFSPMLQYKFDPDAGYHFSTADKDDWAVVKLKGGPNKAIGFFPLDEEAAPAKGAHVTIIQHPNADPKQVADGPIIEVVDSPARRVRYVVAVEGGSSGSPVFDTRWRVVALHSRSATSRDPVTAETIECKEGVHIAAILEGLKRAGVWPHQPGVGDYQTPEGFWIIEREADRDTIKHLRKNRIAVALRGGPQMGQTAVVNRATKQLAAQGWHPVRVDARHDFNPSDYQSGHTFFRRLSEHILDQANAVEALLNDFDDDPTPTVLRTFLERLKSSSPDLRLLLVLEGLDAIGDASCCSAVLSGLRVLYNWQSQSDRDRWLQMLLEYRVTPKQIGPIGSVFDVAKIIEVQDFKVGELQKLAERYGLTQLDIVRLHQFLGGHPHLSRLALIAIQEDDVSLDELINDPAHDGLFDQHLGQLLKEFRDLPDAKALAKAFRDLIGGKPLGNQETFETLYALGMVKGTFHGDAQVRCDLYKEWLPRRLPQ